MKETVTVKGVKIGPATVAAVEAAGVQEVEIVKDENGTVTGFVGTVEHLGNEDSLADIDLQSTEPVSAVLAATLAAIRTGRPISVIHKRE